MSDESIRQEAKAAKERLAQAAQQRGETKETVKPTEETPVQTVQPSAGLTITASQGGDSKDDEVKRLAAELQKHKVEEGRLKKVSEELAELRKENEGLKAKLAELSRVGASERAKGYVDPKRREVIDEDVLTGASEMVEGRVSEAEKALRAEIEELRSRLEDGNKSAVEEANRAFDASIEKAFPGFIASTAPGGQNHSAWTKFLASDDPATGQTYELSVQSAYGRRRLNGVSRVINDFLKDAGISRRDARNDTVQPGGSVSEPGGSVQSGDKKVYTRAEMETALLKSRNDFDKGLIDRRKRQEIIQKYQLAIAEGRVV